MPHNKVTQILGMSESTSSICPQYE